MGQDCQALGWDLLAVHATSIFWGDVRGQKVKGLGVGRGLDRGWGFSRLCSVQQLLKLTLFELGIVSDVVKRVHLHNPPIVKHRVQQVLQRSRETCK